MRREGMILAEKDFEFVLAGIYIYILSEVGVRDSGRDVWMERIYRFRTIIFTEIKRF